MGKRAIRENIIATRALVQLPWLDVARLFFDGNERKVRMFKLVFIEWPIALDAEEREHRHWSPTDMEVAEVIAIIGAPLSHKQHIARIADVMEKVAVRYYDAINQYSKEDASEAKLSRARAAKAERIRLQRKLPRA